MFSSNYRKWVNSIIEELIEKGILKNLRIYFLGMLLETIIYFTLGVNQTQNIVFCYYI